MRVPNLARIVDGDFGYWLTANGHVRVERFAPDDEVDVSVRVGDHGWVATLTVDEATDLAHALLALAALESTESPTKEKAL